MASKIPALAPGAPTWGGFCQGHLRILDIFSFTASCLNNKRSSLFQLFNIFRHLSITTDTVLYQPKGSRNNMKGIFCKNLFLKDRKGHFYIVITEEDKTVDLKHLKMVLKAHRNLNFGSSKELYVKLCLTPGAVTPFGILNDSDSSVTFVIDKALTYCQHTLLNFHPFVEQLTTVITFKDLIRFVEYADHCVNIVELK